jgi:hypothetical protein
LLLNTLFGDHFFFENEGFFFWNHGWEKLNKFDD